MAEQIEIDDSQSSPETRVLRLTGALVISTIFPFQQEVRSDTSPSLIIDLSGISYCDSAGIGALVNAHVSRSRSNRQLALRGVNDRVMNVLKITRVDQLFTFLPGDAASAKSTS